VFISKKIAGAIYVAKQSEKGRHQKKWWKYVGLEEQSVEASEVPRLVRKRAYKMFYTDRREERSEER
jgi:hypothetical protein